MKSRRFIRSPRRRSDARVWKGRCPNHSGVTLAFLHETVLGGTVEFLASALTAFGAHASRLHFFRKLLRAAPASGLPFLPTALLAHVSCAMAGPIAKAETMAGKTIRFMVLPPVGAPVVYSKNCGS